MKIKLLIVTLIVSAIGHPTFAQSGADKKDKDECERPEVLPDVSDFHSISTAAACKIIDEKNSCAVKGNPYIVDEDKKKQLTKDLDLAHSFLKDTPYGVLNLKYKSNDPIGNQLNKMFPANGQEEIINNIQELQEKLKTIGDTTSRTKEAYENTRLKKEIEDRLKVEYRQLNTARHKKFYNLASVLETEYQSSGGFTNQKEFEWHFLNNGEGRNLTSLTIKSSIEKYLAYGQNNDDDSYQKTRDEVVDNLLKFEHEYNCPAEIASYDFVSSIYGDLAKEVATKSRLKNTNLCFPSKQAAMDAVKLNQTILDQHFDENFRGEGALNQGTACTPKYDYGNFNVPVSYQRSCPGRFSQNFENNKWDLDTDKLSGDPEYDAFKSCVQDMKAKGMKLTKIDVQASSSQLNNSGDAAKYFCKKGFQGLSAARAESAKNHLVEILGFKEEEVKTSSQGRNRNGSSGECPYEIVDGKEVMKREYRDSLDVTDDQLENYKKAYVLNSSELSSSDRAKSQSEFKKLPEFKQEAIKAKYELEQARYVKVNAVFEPQVTYGESTGKTCWRFYQRCTQIAYKCRAWPDNKIQRGWPKRATRE